MTQHRPHSAISLFFLFLLSLLLMASAARTAPLSHHASNAPGIHENLAVLGFSANNLHDLHDPHAPLAPRGTLSNDPISAPDAVPDSIPILDPSTDDSGTVSHPEMTTVASIAFLPLISLSVLLVPFMYILTRILKHLRNLRLRRPGQLNLGSVELLPTSMPKHHQLDSGSGSERTKDSFLPKIGIWSGQSNVPSTPGISRSSSLELLQPQSASPTKHRSRSNISVEGPFRPFDPNIFSSTRPFHLPPIQRQPAQHRRSRSLGGVPIRIHSPPHGHSPLSVSSPPTPQAMLIDFSTSSSSNSSSHSSQSIQTASTSSDLGTLRPLEPMISVPGLSGTSHIWAFDLTSESESEDTPLVCVSGNLGKIKTSGTTRGRARGFEPIQQFPIPAFGNFRPSVDEGKREDGEELSILGGGRLTPLLSLPMVPTTATSSFPPKLPMAAVATMTQVVEAEAVRELIDLESNQVLQLSEVTAVNEADETDAEAQEDLEHGQPQTVEKDEESEEELLDLESRAESPALPLAFSPFTVPDTAAELQEMAWTDFPWGSVTRNADLIRFEAEDAQAMEVDDLNVEVEVLHEVLVQESSAEEASVLVSPHEQETRELLCQEPKRITSEDMDEMAHDKNTVVVQASESPAQCLQKEAEPPIYDGCTSVEIAVLVHSGEVEPAALGQDEGLVSDIDLNRVEPAKYVDDKAAKQEDDEGSREVEKSVPSDPLNQDHDTGYDFDDNIPTPSIFAVTPFHADTLTLTETESNPPFDVERTNMVYKGEPSLTPAQSRSSSSDILLPPLSIPMIKISSFPNTAATEEEYPDPDFLPLPMLLPIVAPAQSPTASLIAEKPSQAPTPTERSLSQSQTPTPPASPPLILSPLRAVPLSASALDATSPVSTPSSSSMTSKAVIPGSPINKPAWSLRASDSPALGLSASPSSPANPVEPGSVHSLRLREKKRAEGGGDEDITPCASPSKMATSLPGSFPGDVVGGSLLASPSQSASEASSIDSLSASASTATSSSASKEPIPSVSSALSPVSRPFRPSLRSLRSPLDIALAMQLRPGLGLGADPAWMVRFLMAMFGWFAVLVSGQGEAEGWLGIAR